MEILKQPQYDPLPEAFEYLSIWIVTNGYTDNIPVDDIQRFEKEYHEYIKMNHKKIVEELSTGAKPSEELTKQIQKATESFKKGFK